MSDRIFDNTQALTVVGDLGGDEDGFLRRYRGLDTFARENPGVQLHFFTDEEDTSAIAYPPDNLIIQHTDQPLEGIAGVVGKYSMPALFSMRNTSDLITTLVGKRIWRLHKGLRRPVLVCEAPKPGGFYTMADVGGSTRAESLQEMALAGFFAQIVAQEILGLPGRVGILQIGTEKEKGGMVPVWEMFQELFAELFVGNVEPNDVSKADALAGASFPGNIALKAIEGGVLTVLAELAARLDPETLLSVMSKLTRVDIKSYNGAYVMGGDIPLIAGHGSANEAAMIAALKRAVAPKTRELYRRFQDIDVKDKLTAILELAA